MYDKELPTGERVSLEDGYQDSEYDSDSEEEGNDSTGDQGEGCHEAREKGEKFLIDINSYPFWQSYFFVVQSASLVSVRHQYHYMNLVNGRFACVVVSFVSETSLGFHSYVSEAFETL